MIKDVEDLEIYNRSMKLLVPIYRLAQLLPRREFKLADQLTSAAKSISATIAEGFAKRRSTKEFKRYLEMSLGSSDEVTTHLRQIKLIGFPKVKAETVDALIKHYRIVSKQLNTLIKTWKNFKSDISDSSDFPDKQSKVR
jgi:four helix bundle protein